MVTYDVINIVEVGSWAQNITVDSFFSLHERPISGTGNVDLVIYAAQLSQSFFCDLAVAVEGFLDLFLVASEGGSDVPKDERFDDSSSMLTASQRNVPPAALAAVVLWCDSELAKFSSAFGGTRILGNLALSPPPRRDSSTKRKSRKGHEEDHDASRERNVRVFVSRMYEATFCGEESSCLCC